MKTYQRIAQLLDWETKNKKATLYLEWVEKNILPRGSGVDSGTKIKENSTSEKIVLSFGFHHMDENGYYDGWTEHQAIITPSLSWSFNLKITGKDKRGIKEYLRDLFEQVMSEEWEESIIPEEIQKAENEIVSALKVVIP